jgi:putative SbcD/Mre11-related phosphoesterase
MNDLEIADGFLATPQRFLWHEASGTAVVADVHLGAEAELTRRGILMPDVSRRALEIAWKCMADRLRQRSARGENGHVVIAGDLFDVPSPDPEARAAAIRLIQELPQNCQVTLLCGNHDPPAPLLREWFQDLPVVVEHTAAVGGYTIAHGHQLGAVDGGGRAARGLIVGHQHPAVMLRDRVQSAKMICFAACGGKSGTVQPALIILPSFSRAPLGSNLLTEHHWIIDAPRPSAASVRIAGIVEPTGKAARVLDFGPLDGLQ